MKITRINPTSFIIKCNGYKQYYIKGKMLQINPDGTKVLVDTHNMQTIRKVRKNGK